MTSVRLIENAEHNPMTPCSRCETAGCPWDRVADKPLCPDCQERLALGEADALVERVDAGPVPSAPASAYCAI